MLLSIVSKAHSNIFMNRRGFTLIELLVVITIIAILSAISIVALSTVAKNGRDAKRKTDLKTIQSALEYYYADQGYYPIQTNVLFGNSLKSPDNNKTYYNKLPKDPSYKYTPSPDDCDYSADNKCVAYCLKAKLENPSNDESVCGTDAGYNFGVTPI